MTVISRLVRLATSTLFGRRRANGSSRAWRKGVCALTILWALGTAGSGNSPLGGSASAAFDLFEDARASFTGVADGSGDGRSQPAEIGSITTFTSSGRSLKDVAPASGVVREQLVLSDAGTAGTNDIGYRVGLEVPAAGGVYGAFTVEPKADGGHFKIRFHESADGEFALPGSAGDGSTVEMFSIEVTDGQLVVSGHPLKTQLKKGGRYLMEAAMANLSADVDYFEFWITDLATNKVESVIAELASDYHPVRAIEITKFAGDVSDWAIDDFLVLAPAK